MTVGYLRHEYEKFSLKIPLSIRLPKKTSNILMVGKSGSGKSFSARFYIWNMLHTGESNVYISDYKGGEEYEAFEGSSSYASGNEAIDMIHNFYSLFTEIRNRRIKLKHHITLFMEEYLGVLTYAETQSK